MAYMTIEDTIGNTPLVQLVRLADDEIRSRNNVVLGKLEGNNPAGSVKDRPALSMIKKAEERGRIKPGDTLIEATSGNTGIALAMAAAVRGYKMVLLMPEDLSVERRQSMAAYGAQIVLTPVDGRHGIRARSRRADAARRQGHHPRPVREPGQSARARTRRTGPELWRQTEGRITHFVSAMGTTGTIMGVSQYLKEQNETIEIIGAQPEEGSRIPGIRKWPEAYLPKIFDRSRVDRVENVSQAASEAMARQHGVGRRDLQRHFVGRRLRSRVARRAPGRERDDRVHRLRSRRPLSVDGRVPGLIDRARAVAPNEEGRSESVGTAFLLDAGTSRPKASLHRRRR